MVVAGQRTVCMCTKRSQNAALPSSERRGPRPLGRALKTAMLISRMVHSQGHAACLPCCIGRRNDAGGIAHGRRSLVLLEDARHQLLRAGSAWCVEGGLVCRPLSVPTLAPWHCMCLPSPPVGRASASRPRSTSLRTPRPTQLLSSCPVGQARRVEEYEGPAPAVAGAAGGCAGGG